MSVANILISCPSQYAIQKLSVFKFVDLWYFSAKGCAKAASKSTLQADDSLGITKTGGTFSFKPLAATKASRNVIQDQLLSFESFLYAKNNFLVYVRKANWPVGNIDTLSLFFWKLETHTMHKNPLGNQILLTYAARVHRNWHDKLKANKGYDISIINNNLMCNITFEIQLVDQQKMKAKVCNSPHQREPLLIFSPVFSITLLSRHTGYISPPNGRCHGLHPHQPQYAMRTAARTTSSPE